jgi:hypothetical protein
MKYFLVLLLFSIFNFQKAYCQILSVVGETEFSVQPNTDLSFDKILFKPSRQFIITNNTLSKIDQRSINSGTQGAIYIFEKSVPFYFGNIEVQSNVIHNDLSIGVRSFQNTSWSKVDNSNFNRSNNFYIGNIVNSINIKEVALVGNEKMHDFDLISNPIVNSSVDVNVYQPCVLYITTTTGQILLKKELSKGLHKIDVSKLPKSSYFISSSQKTVSFIN